MKLTIVIEGTDEEVEAIAGHLSDGGGEQHLTPIEYQEEGRFLVFDYAKCFPAWGYKPEQDGSDLLVTAKLSDPE